jgi:rhamnogalacturonan endolyase
MHDHTYRLAVAWQNTAYNQPPHLGYNLAVAMLPAITDTNMEQQAVAGSAYTFTGKLKNSTTVYMLSTTLPDGTKLGTNKLPDGFELTKAADMSSFTLTGTPETLGDYEFTFRLVGYNGESVNETLTLHVVESIPGDVNGDGKVNVGDIMAVINIMAQSTSNLPQPGEAIPGDVNGDGKVNVGDIMAVINIMASK